MNLQPGQVVAHRFRLVRELGRGGVGAVWLAHQIALDVPCAVKFFIGSETDLEQYCRRFEIEAKAAARIHHPNVVRIIDTGVSEGRPYIAMELLLGEGLDARLHRRRRLIPSEMVAFCNQVGAALTKAHALGIVHRDLKPSNIFLSREQERLVVKLIDFGIAKASVFAEPPSPLTHTETILGTPHYMSPEQIEGTQPIDGRSDLWSLGVIVFECLTGKLPFDAPTVGDLFSRITYKPIPVPSQVAPGMPLSFNAWWSRASARDVSSRFQTPAEFCDTLARALGVGPGSELDAWKRISTSGMPAVAASFQPTLSGQARPSSMRPVRPRSSKAPAVIGALCGVAALAALTTVLWTPSARSPRPREASAPSEPLSAAVAPASVTVEVASAMSDPPEAPLRSAAPAPPEVSPLPSAEPEATAAPAPDASTSATPTATSRVEAAPEPSTTSSPGRSKGRVRHPGKSKQSSEWGF